MGKGRGGAVAPEMHVAPPDRKGCLGHDTLGCVGVIPNSALEVLVLCLQDHGLGLKKDERSLNLWLEGEPAILEMPGARAVFDGVTGRILALGAALVLYSKARQWPVWL